MLQIDRRLLANFDWVMLLTLLVIAVMGLVNLYSASHTGQEILANYHVKQMCFFGFGFGLILAAIKFDYRQVLSWNYYIYGLIILLLLATLFLGKTIAGTHRWIDLGFFRLQPSEPAKLAMVITLASYYYRRDTGKGFTLKDLAAPMLLTAVPFLLIVKQPDLGTALMLIFIFVSMTLFVKLRWSTFILLSSACIAAIPFGWNFVLKPYQKQRIMTFLNPEADMANTGYHIMQSKIAVGSGLKFGKGYLQGTQGHLDFLPERHTDFAFSIWAEEWGFVGSLFFLGVYFFFILWGLNIAVSSKDKFGILLAFGILSLIFWQAFINLAMILGLLPVVGMPLPFVSYGGSSLVTSMAGVALLFSIRMRRYRA